MDNDIIDTGRGRIVPVVCAAVALAGCVAAVATAWHVTAAGRMDCAGGEAQLRLAAARGLYTEPTYAQVERLIAAAGGATVKGSSLYSRPTYAQVERLIEATQASGGAVAVDIPADAAARGVTFTCAKPNPDDPSQTCGEEDNGAVEIGRNAKAAISQSALSAAPDGTVARSVSVAIGAEADATASPDTTKSQGIAIGWHAQAKGSNAIAIGSGAQHTFEDAMSGASAYASESTAIAIGYSAKATAVGAVQIGPGTNSTAQSLQFRQWQVLDGSGQVPTGRLASAFAHVLTPSSIERVLQPGNMAVVYGGLWDQVVEPRLDGLCEVEMSKAEGDERYMAGAETLVRPPLGSRNYDLVITNIPQAYRWEKDESEGRYLAPVPEDQNFLLSLEEIPSDMSQRLRCDPSIGYVNGNFMVLTNAPLVVKVRQPVTNRVVIVVKPWDEMLDI